MKNISRRLKEMANYIDNFNLLVDIGTDHAYLPIYLIKNKKVKKIIAGEILPGPYQSALKSVLRYGLEKQIEVRLGDGLDILGEERPEIVTISGMGGKLITNILERNTDKLSKTQLLVLQPMSQEYLVRKWLLENNYTIIDEKIIEEENIIYEIIIANKVPVRKEMNELELKYGPYLLREKNEIFYKKWKYELEKNKLIEKNIQEKSKEINKSNLLIIKEKIMELQEILK